MESYEIKGYYGSGHTPAVVYIYSPEGELYWYAVKNSQNVNGTHHRPADGDDVEEFADCDTFTWSSGIDALDTLIKVVDDALDDIPY